MCPKYNINILKYIEHLLIIKCKKTDAHTEGVVTNFCLIKINKKAIKQERLESIRIYLIYHFRIHFFISSNVNLSYKIFYLLGKILNLLSK